MINKIYVKLRDFMKENYLILSLFLVMSATLLYPLPFYIYTGGGAIDTSSRVEVKGESKSEGSLHFLYVAQRNAYLPTYILAKILPNWDIENISAYQINEEETIEEMSKRDKLYLEEANTAATFTAYNHAGANITINSQKLSVIYIQKRDKTDLKIGDVILKVNGESIKDIQDIKKVVSEHEVGEKITLEVLRDGKKHSCYAEVFSDEEDTNKYIGVSALTTYDYELDPKMKLKFKRNESGPSGGLMLALTIYDKLVEEDITHGFKIVGTGTIDKEGNVGTIGGVKYKLRGAISEKADVMLVPNGENYDECMKIKNEEDLDIEIIGVSTFQEALDALETLKK